MTKVTVCITAGTIDGVLSEIRDAQTKGADIIEIRLDYLKSRDFKKIVKESSLPIIWTLRHKSEGGKFDGSIESQFETLIDAMQAGGEYVDIEYHRWVEARHFHHRVEETISKLRASGRTIKLILSFHDFNGTPHYITSLANRIARDKNADIVKAACMVNNICENFYIFDLLEKVRKPAIALGMGELGVISRILSRKFGAELTFASLGAEKASAPGQLTTEEMKEEYNWDKIDSETKIAGVIGYPVNHSLSPIMHNCAYKKMNFNATYLKFNIAEHYVNFALFLDFIPERPECDFIGLSVTIPHKTNALRYLQEHSGHIDPLAEKIGAVNTIVLHPDGKLSGYNTDYLGLLKALKEVGGVTESHLKGKKVAILGAGGVSRAITAAMVTNGAEVTIYNRTESKAEKLAEQFGCSWKPWSKRGKMEAEIVINGTSIGMLGNEDQSPLKPETIRKNMVVFDTIYNPLETKLLNMAKQTGAKTVDGANMLVYQAERQISLWLEAQKIIGCEIPVDLMKKAVLEKL